MANISKRNRRREREIQNASKNRREIIAARLSRRDLIKAGLLTSAGYLIHKKGLSARAQFGVVAGANVIADGGTVRGMAPRSVRPQPRSSSHCSSRLSPSRLLR